jgi:hypothetical protein
MHRERVSQRAMSALGQKPKNLQRADVFRFGSNSGHQQQYLRALEISSATPGLTRWSIVFAKFLQD